MAARAVSEVFTQDMSIGLCLFVDENIFPPHMVNLLKLEKTTLFTVMTPGLSNVAFECELGMTASETPQASK